MFGGLESRFGLWPVPGSGAIGVQKEEMEEKLNEMGLFK